MFEYVFMQKAFITGIILAIALPCVGVTIVLKRLSMTGDALSHCSLAGVAGGILAGINPIAGSLVACVGASLGIEAIRRVIPRYSEISIAVVSAAGMGLAGVLSGFTGNTSNMNSFLFGSIVSVSDAEVVGVAILGLLAVAFSVIMRRPLLSLTLDERIARTSGVPVSLINFLFSLIIAVVIAIAARTAGALIVSSMLVIPVACAMQTAKSYRALTIHAVCYAVGSTLMGLTVSYYFGLKPGGTIILIEVALLVILLVVRAVSKHVRKGSPGRSLETTVGHDHEVVSANRTNLVS